MTSSDNSKFVAPNKTKAGGLEHCWWLAIGLSLKDIEIYYGWSDAHSAPAAIFGAIFALAIVYTLRWAFSQ